LIPISITPLMLNSRRQFTQVWFIASRFKTKTCTGFIFYNLFIYIILNFRNWSGSLEIIKWVTWWPTGHRMTTPYSPLGENLTLTGNYITLYCTLEYQYETNKSVNLLPRDSPSTWIPNIYILGPMGFSKIINICYKVHYVGTQSALTFSEWKRTLGGLYGYT
jgi:hypothetical protein